MLAEQNDPIFYAFGAEVSPRCSQCGLPMHMTEHRQSALMGAAYETQRFALRVQIRNGARCRLRKQNTKRDLI
jgi:hypothetical protein